ncbi:MAG: aldolase/citrate lyase family protein [Chloroflexi bacterium]|nr:aldolase/citrate lyase family protein [Chloroflexota bacterium]
MEPAQLKATLKAGKPVFGFMIAAIEGLRWSRVYAGSTLDYIIIDWEHTSRSRARIAEIVTSIKSAGVTCIIRTPNTDDSYVAIALDAGADGVLVPYCETVEEVRACANKVRLHPLKGEYFERAGLTGELPSEKTREYLHNRHKDHIFIMGVESEPCVNRLDELLQCAKIDGIFVGPNDLTTSLGIPDEVDNPKYLEVLKHIIDTGEKYGVPTMVHQQSIETSTKAIELGSRFVLHSSDVGILLKGIQSDFAELREVAAGKFGEVEAREAEDTLETI